MSMPTTFKPYHTESIWADIEDTAVRECVGISIEEVAKPLNERITAFTQALFAQEPSPPMKPEFIVKVVLSEQNVVERFFTELFSLFGSNKVFSHEVNVHKETFSAENISDMQQQTDTISGAIQNDLTDINTQLTQKIHLHDSQKISKADVTAVFDSFVNKVHIRLHAPSTAASTSTTPSTIAAPPKQVTPFKPSEIKPASAETTHTTAQKTFTTPSAPPAPATMPQPPAPTPATPLIVEQEGTSPAPAPAAPFTADFTGIPLDTLKDQVAAKSQREALAESEIAAAESAKMQSVSPQFETADIAANQLLKEMEEIKSKVAKSSFPAEADKIQQLIDAFKTKKDQSKTAESLNKEIQDFQRVLNSTFSSLTQKTRQEEANLLAAQVDAKNLIQNTREYTTQFDENIVKQFNIHISELENILTTDKNSKELNDHLDFFKGRFNTLKKEVELLKGRHQEILRDIDTLRKEIKKFPAPSSPEDQEKINEYLQKLDTFSKFNSIYVQTGTATKKTRDEIRQIRTDFNIFSNKLKEAETEKQAQLAEEAKRTEARPAALAETLPPSASMPAATPTVEEAAPAPSEPAAPHETTAPTGFKFTFPEEGFFPKPPQAVSPEPVSTTAAPPKVEEEAQTVVKEAEVPKPQESKTEEPVKKAEVAKPSDYETMFNKFKEKQQTFIDNLTGHEQGIDAMLQLKPPQLLGAEILRRIIPEGRKLLNEMNKEELTSQQKEDIARRVEHANKEISNAAKWKTPLEQYKTVAQNPAGYSAALRQQISQAFIEEMLEKAESGYEDLQEKLKQIPLENISKNVTARASEFETLLLDLQARRGIQAPGEDEKVEEAPAAASYAELEGLKKQLDKKYDQLLNALDAAAHARPEEVAAEAAAEAKAAAETKQKQEILGEIDQEVQKGLALIQVQQKNLTDLSEKVKAFQPFFLRQALLERETALKDLKGNEATPLETLDAEELQSHLAKVKKQVAKTVDSLSKDPYHLQKTLDAYSEFEKQQTAVAEKSKVLKFDLKNPQHAAAFGLEQLVNSVMKKDIRNAAKKASKNTLTTLADTLQANAATLKNKLEQIDKQTPNLSLLEQMREVGNKQEASNARRDIKNAFIAQVKPEISDARKMIAGLKTSLPQPVGKGEVKLNLTDQFVAQAFNSVDQTLSSLQQDQREVARSKYMVASEKTTVFLNELEEAELIAYKDEADAAVKSTAGVADSLKGAKKGMERAHTEFDKQLNEAKKQLPNLEKQGLKGQAEELKLIINTAEETLTKSPKSFSSFTEIDAFKKSMGEQTGKLLAAVADALNPTVTETRGMLFRTTEVRPKTPFDDLKEAEKAPASPGNTQVQTDLKKFIIDQETPAIEAKLAACNADLATVGTLSEKKAINSDIADAYTALITENRKRLESLKADFTPTSGGAAKKVADLHADELAQWKEQINSAGREVDSPHAELLELMQNSGNLEVVLQKTPQMLSGLRALSRHASAASWEKTAKDIQEHREARITAFANSIKEQGGQGRASGFKAYSAFLKGAAQELNGLPTVESELNTLEDQLHMIPDIRSTDYQTLRDTLLNDASEDIDQAKERLNQPALSHAPALQPEYFESVQNKMVQILADLEAKKPGQGKQDAAWKDHLTAKQFTAYRQEVDAMIEKAEEELENLTHANALENAAAALETKQNEVVAKKTAYERDSRFDLLDRLNEAEQKSYTFFAAAPQILKDEMDAETLHKTNSDVANYLETQLEVIKEGEKNKPSLLDQIRTLERSGRADSEALRMAKERFFADIRKEIDKNIAEIDRKSRDPDYGPEHLREFDEMKIRLTELKRQVRIGQQLKSVDALTTHADREAYRAKVQQELKQAESAAFGIERKAKTKAEFSI